MTSATTGVTATTAINQATDSAATTATAPETAQLHPVRVDGKWGFIDKTGTVKIEPRFAGVLRHDGEDGHIQGFSEGLVEVRLVEGGPWGYLDETGEVVIEPRFRVARPFSEGLAAVLIANSCYFIDKTGATVLGTFQDARDFSDGLAYVSNGNAGAGFIDKNGDWVVTDVMQSGDFHLNGGFSEGVAPAYTRCATEGEPVGLMGYVDISGSWVIKPQFEYARDFREGLALVREKWESAGYYINKSGAVVISVPGIGCWGFSGGIARVGSFDGSPTYIDKTGKVIWQGE